MVPCSFFLTWAPLSNFRWGASVCVCVRKFAQLALCCNVCMYACMYMYMYMYIYIYIYIYMYMYMYMYVSTYSSIYLYMYRSARTWYSSL